ncbi:MAG: hypothetical protein F6K50_20055 [Moorea sp. SIO3I7]|uniref:hypothetical protein n=1 Tax=Moorena sp. SIO3I8 TaxID=2607833 RepID=UPI0013C17C7B|nr:hypothetical protein [Moorena sp. SIO3I8]NEN97735.1 hypothetical protein [Moorena sp. SIO3I7]NEO09335.1 hypothetical protein [Moorena sp. SIO3I8]
MGSDSRFPFPSWEGLGVGSDSRFPFPSWEGLGVGSDSLLPSLYYQNPRFPVGSTVVQLVLA